MEVATPPPGWRTAGLLWRRSTISASSGGHFLAASPVPAQRPRQGESSAKRLVAVSEQRQLAGALDPGTRRSADLDPGENRRRYAPRRCREAAAELDGRDTASPGRRYRRLGDIAFPQRGDARWIALTFGRRLPRPGCAPATGPRQASSVSWAEAFGQRITIEAEQLASGLLDLPGGRGCSRRYSD